MNDPTRPPAGAGESPPALEPELAAALRAPVPRTPEQTRLIIGRGGRFYRGLGLIMWSVVVLIPAVVGFTSPGREWSTFFDGLLMTILIFGVPTQIFVTVGRREITALARTGEMRTAVVSRAGTVGQPGKEIVDVAMNLARANGSVAVLQVSGLPVLPSVGDVYHVLVDPARPKVAGVIAPPVGIYVARVRRE